MLMIDSNIWAYYFDGTTPEHEHVRKIVGSAIFEDVILVNTIIQVEVAHYLVKRLGPILGKEKLDIFLGYPFKVDILDQDSVSSSIEMLG
ncbi:MAG: hypothetical protein ACE5PM_09505, partial [Candidatus Hydrothermarchaeales archaeon]